MPGMAVSAALPQAAFSKNPKKHQGPRGMSMDWLLQNITSITWQMAVMWVIGGALIYCAIKKDMEPTLLLPMKSSSGKSSVAMPAS